MSFNPETPKAAALNPMPPVVMALFLMIAGVEALFALASIGVLGEGFDASWRFFAIERYGMNTNLVSWMRETQDYDRLCAVFGDGQNGWQRVFRPCRINVLFCVSGAGRVGLLPDCARGRLVIWGFSRDLWVNRGPAGAGRQSV